MLFIIIIYLCIPTAQIRDRFMNCARYRVGLRKQLRFIYKLYQSKTKF